MKKSSMYSSLLALLCIFTFNAHSATVEIKFTDPDKYVDIRSGEKNDSSFRENVFYNLEKQLKKLAKDLPEDQLLKLEVTDIDLAGDTLIGGINRIRIVKQMYPPRIKFNYQLVEKDKSIIVEGEENIRNTSFMMNQSLRYKRDAFGFEKQLLEEWFDKTFEEKIIKSTT